ncbi:uncharacterized protein LOC128236681 isoform X2 [Mya arenaria]|nr:uncharacterized protein LOC128236681 isoform X2 [Mya arenaria]
MAIVGKSPEEIQQHLNRLLEYCNNWGLSVNILKTKNMVFRKRGGLLPSEHWTYNGQSIEVVNDFNYLGTVFNYTGNYALNQEHLTGKALKALNVLLCKCREYDLKPKILCQLFDAFVAPFLNYASEIWGYTKSKEIERINLKFCKRLLNVRKNTCTASVYGELGRYPLYVHRFVRIIQYWLKVVRSDNIITRTVYRYALSDCVIGKNNWVSNVRKLLSEFGFGYVFDNASVPNEKYFLCELKTRIIDCFRQKWYRSLDSPVLFLYKDFKTTFGYEHYLDILPKSLRLFFCRLRLSVHPLRIQTGRYNRNRIQRDKRYCLCCNRSDIEDEFHFICICPCFNLIRKKYIKRNYYIRPSVLKFIELLNSTNRQELIKLSLFVKEALCIRRTTLNIEI